MSAVSARFSAGSRFRKSLLHRRLTKIIRGGLLIECNNFRLLIDPYISDCIQKLEGFRRLHPFPLPLADLKVDLLLICINGKLNNMDSNEALRYVQKSTPRTALPMHIGLFAENTADPQSFIEKCLAINVKSFAMTPGKEFAI